MSVPSESPVYRRALALLLALAVAQAAAWAWIELPRPAGAGRAHSAGAVQHTPGNGPDLSMAANATGTMQPAAGERIVPDLSTIIEEDVPVAGERDPRENDPQLTPEQFVLRTALERVQLARSARSKGDTEFALNALREALALVPDNAEVLAEMATTYEIMGLFDKSASSWQQILDLDAEKAGIYRAIASEKLARGVGDETALDERSVAETADQYLAPFRENALVRIDGITAEERLNEDGATSVDMIIPLRAAGGALDLEIRDVKIQVYFYDLLDDQNVVLTNAVVSSEWQTPPPDWRDDGVERLIVSYQQTPLELSTEDNRERREYLGYIVRIYYKGQLQDAASEPSRLMELYPTPETLTF